MGQYSSIRRAESSLVSWILVLTLVFVGVGSSPAYASTAVSDPGTEAAFTLGFADIGENLVLSGFSATVRVVVATDDPDGQLRITSSSGLSRVTGYDNSSSITAPGDSIAFEGTQAAANTALASLEYKGDAVGSDSITVTVTESGVAAREEVRGGQTYYHYYRSVSGSRTWTSARSHAQQAVTLGGTSVNGWLVTILSDTENEFVTTYIGSDAWMGAHDTGTEGSWVWVAEAEDVDDKVFWQGTSSGSLQNYYANWAAGEPNDYMNGIPGEDAGQFYSGRTNSDGATWNDLPHNSTSLSSYIWEYASTTQLVAPTTRSFSVNVTTPQGSDAISGLSATAGVGLAALTWTAPASSGDFPVSDYRVEYSDDAGVSWQSFTDGVSTATSASVTGLTAGESYVFRITPVTVLDGQVSSASSSVTIPSVPSQVSGLSATAGNQLIDLAWAAPSDGGSAITDYVIERSDDGGSNWSTVTDGVSTSTTFQATGLTNGLAYSFRVSAKNLVGTGSTSAAAVATPVAPPAPQSDVSAPTPAVVPEPTLPTPRFVPPRPSPPVPSVQQGPVLRGNVPPAPPSAPVATIGGRSIPIQTQVTSPSGFSLTAGVLNLGLQVQQDQGVVRQNNTGGTEIEVRKGSTAAVTGTGLLPRSTVQVFLPLQGTNAKEIARIPVDETGAFSGDAVFATRANERPLPIGRQLLQVVSLDEDGQQSVVEMAVNIAQPPPSPEPDRTAGATPTLRPGQFLATNAGEPEIVTVVPVPEDRQARVEGDGWQMAVDIPSANGAVAASDEGGALLQLVRDETAVVSGTGFMPGTRADVWLFSEPTLLGTVDIDENGEFSGEVNIDANVVVVGEHTLQLQGVGEDGYVRAANLGVVVNDTAAEVTTEEAAGGFLWWLWLLVALVVLILWFVIWRYRRSREA